MQYSASIPASEASKPRGFALVITLTLMMLLTVIALGLLSLSVITLRSTTRGDAMAVAKSNARLGLMLAIGEIQKELGPDQRITAVSEILNPGSSTTAINSPHLTGVWKSRQEGLGTTPDYDRNTDFQRWLISSSNPDELLNPDFALTGDFDSPVLMARAHGGASQATYAGMVSTSKPGSKGDFAWWVADENSKGFTNPVDSLSLASAPTVADLLASMGTPGAYGMKAVDKNYPSNTPAAAKVLTYGQLALAASANDGTRDSFHDLSPHSQGLLTNVVKGGLREDLNLYLELPRTPASDPWPQSPAPAALGPNNKYALSEVDDHDVLGWKHLHNYYHLKGRIQMINGRPTLSAWNGSTGATAADLTNPRWNAGVMRPAPVLVRAVIFVAFGSIEAPSDPSKQILRFYANPIITLWNPYNVDMKIEVNQLNYLFSSLPMGHKISINGELKETFTWRGPAISVAADGANNYQGAGLRPTLNKSITLLPGEARMLSSTSNRKGAIGFHQVHTMEDVPFVYTTEFPGGMWGGGIKGEKVDDQEIVHSTGTATDRVEIETFVTRWDLDGAAFNRSYPATFDIRGNHAADNDGDYPAFQWGQKIGWMHESTTPPIASPDRLTTTNKPVASFAEITDAPRPFMVVDVQLKALDETDLPNKTWRDCIPAHPYQGVTREGSDVTPYLSSAYKVRFDTINSYQEASSYLQIAPDNPVHTFFGGSYFPASGQSWITDREVMMAPFTSLAQLQHLPQQSVDNLYSSGFHFQNRAIGNSFASPGIPSDQVKTSTGFPFCVDAYMNSSGGTIGGSKFPSEQFHTRPNIDRSYAANHLLWDDYFFSSMAAKNDMIRGASGRKTIDRVVTDFFRSGTPLPNERYRPYLGGKSSAVVIPRLVRGSTPTTNGYKEAAAYLLVDGSFNVNSTSITAWKTVLAAAHRKNIVTMERFGKPGITGAENFVISRFSMPNGRSSSATAPAATDREWQGYHEISETQIGELAEAIVRQVKLRGPFRSLAEFINRRLGPESDVRSHYGALQAALEDPKVSINAKYRSSQITDADIQNSAYQNKSAALGPRYQGSPPYVTQADLLNSVGPVLSARSDTFLVRAYGQARDTGGEVVARAWCEAVVQRVPAWVDSKDSAEIAPISLTSPVNRLFGRRFNLISFRWLAENEL